MRKILLSLLAVTTGASAFAANNLFQQFDDQYNLGYGATQTTLQNGAGTQSLASSQFLNLEVERLFDMGLWLKVDADMATSSSTSLSGAVGGGQPSNTTTQDPNLGGINARLGYAFSLADQHLLITPYALVGRNTNLAQSTIITNGQANITNDVYYTGGIGGRIEYRINNAVLVYADQNGTYNWDQSGPINGIMPQNNMEYTSTIGAKFNVVRNFQIGVNGFYNNYQSMATAPTEAQAGGSGNVGVYQPQSGFGGLVSVGLTY